MSTEELSENRGLVSLRDAKAIIADAQCAQVFGAAVCAQRHLNERFWFRGIPATSASYYR